MFSVRRHAKPHRRARGFTLLEMMLVVVIIGLLVSVAVINLAGQSTKAREGTTAQSLKTIQTGVNLYFTNTGSYPPNLQVLIPNIMPKIAKDAWRQDFVYYPTPTDANRPYVLFSMGQDQLSNTADDINVWTVDE